MLKEGSLERLKTVSAQWRILGLVRRHEGWMSSCLDGLGAVLPLVYWLGDVNLDNETNAWVAWAGDELT